MAIAVFLLAVFFLSVVVSIALSIMQIRYVKRLQGQKAEILSDAVWQSAAEYSKVQEKVSIFSTIYNAVIFLWWIAFGLRFLDFIYIESSALKAVCLMALFVCFNEILTLPINYYKSFIVDAKYGFNNTTKSIFTADWVKSLVITLLLVSAIAYILSEILLDYAISRWIAVFFILMIMLIAINMLFPVIRAKFFDKFTPIDQTELGASIIALLEKAGFKSKGVFCVDASKRDTRLNAYFAGIGATKSVVLYDTLVEKLSKDEILAVLGHELGHFRHKDIYKNIAVIGVLLFAFLAIFANLPSGYFEFFGLQKSSHVIMLSFVLFSSPLFFFAAPLFNFISRRNEFAADQFGAELTSKEALKLALIKLINENKSFPKKQPLYALFYETHPNIIERLDRLQ
ncbi:MAG: M48 family metallopeptidase [Helicobacteraceae bacterium]|nr:M48 family metallopeptidase [Helicobacteraceae bacterium]